MALESRERWIRSAAGWEARADAFRAATMPVATWMIDALAPQSGETVLDLAAGIGDTGFLAAELLEPGGTLICADFAPEMLAAAQRRAEKLKIRNVRFRQMDASKPLDQPAASLDGVLCRWGYMLMDDSETALRETRRVLRLGGRVALAAWTEADENQWSSAAVKLLLDRNLTEPEPPGTPGQFAWGAEGVVAEQLQNAGFVEFQVSSVEFAMRYASVDDWWHVQTQMSPRTADAATRMDTAALDDFKTALAALAEPFTTPDGSLEIPARTWVAAATA
jgi:SAM-dependent methyltransferase